MATTIYLDETTQELLREHKKNNPEFNLSAFIQKMIKEYSFENEDIDLDKVTHAIQNTEIDIKRLEEKKRYLCEKKREGIKRQNQSKETKKQEISDTIESILKYTHADEKDAKALAEEWNEIKHKITLTAFLTEKKVGFK